MAPATYPKRIYTLVPSHHLSTLLPPRSTLKKCGLGGRFQRENHRQRPQRDSEVSWRLLRSEPRFNKNMTGTLRIEHWTPGHKNHNLLYSLFSGTGDLYFPIQHSFCYLSAFTNTFKGFFTMVNGKIFSKKCNVLKLSLIHI